MKRIAEQTRLNIIAATGYYIDAALSAWMRNASVEELEHRLVDDIRTGGAQRTATA